MFERRVETNDGATLRTYGGPKRIVNLNFIVQLRETLARYGIPADLLSAAFGRRKEGLVEHHFAIFPTN
jgi:hypothetical protein